MSDREILARALCQRAGYDPDEVWEEYDRNASAAVSTFGEYEGWQDDVFPKYVRWHQFLPDADTAITTLSSLWKDRAAKVVELEAELLEWRECAMFDATMEGPVFKGWNRSQMERCRQMMEAKR